MGIKVGIDLGTTNSAISYIKDGKPVIIENKEGQRTTPSVIYIDDKGNTTVGKQAKNMAVSMPKHVVIESKRLMGTDTKIDVNGKTLRPEEAGARVLEYLVRSAEERTGQEVDEAIITVPAYFNDTQRRATQKAAEIAKLKVERLVNEPTAAAIAFAFENLDKNSTMLVYDLGGGTFDVSIVEVFDGMVEVKASAGNNNLGGKDFDEMLAKYIIQKYEQDQGIELSSLPDYEATFLRIKEAAENLKIQLSQQEIGSAVLPFIGLHNNVPLSLNVDVSRAEFESLIKKSVESTINEVKEALKDSKLELAEITDVIMVGGSTRIPLVRETMQKYYGRPLRVDINPDEVVALGASVQMGLKAQDETLKRNTNGGLMVIDVCPYSLGAGIFRGQHDSTLYYDEIIPRNTTIPTVKNAIYYTMQDNQDVVEIDIYQAEKYTGTETIHSPGVVQLSDRPLVVSGLPPRRAGEVKIEVGFKYNMNGILEVTAEILGYGIKQEMTVEPKSGMTYFETQEAAATLETDVTKTELYTRMKPIIIRAEQMLKTAVGNDREKIDTLLSQLKNAMFSNDADRAEQLEMQLTDVLIDLM